MVNRDIVWRMVAPEGSHGAVWGVLSGAPLPVGEMPLYALAHPRPPTPGTPPL